MNAFKTTHKVMNISKKSIRTRLEEQAKSEIKKEYTKKPKQTHNKDALRLNWKDAVVFSLIMVFGCGYWIQSAMFMAIGG